MRHFRNAKFRDLYEQLPADIRATADKSYIPAPATQVASAKGGDPCKYKQS